MTHRMKLHFQHLLLQNVEGGRSVIYKSREPFLQRGGLDSQQLWVKVRTLIFFSQEDIA